MNLSLVKMEVVRFIRTPEAIFQIILLPAMLYVLFGAIASYGEQPLGHGNVNAAVLLNISVYATAQAGAAYIGTTAIENLQGWGRQLRLTSQTTRSYITTRLASAVLITTITIIVLFTLGALLGAEIPVARLAVAALLMFIGVVMTTLYVLTIANVTRAEAGTNIALGILVVFGFAGNIFTPLSGVILQISRFTPLWGIGELVRYPLAEGKYFSDSGGLYTTPLWMMLANIGFWLIFFAGTAYLTSKRKSR